MKFFLLLLSALSLSIHAQKKDETAKINGIVDAWHKAAADGDGTAYINAMTEDGIFVGTDATEHWDRDAFWKFAEPFFKKGKAWDFRPMERHVYFSADGRTAWFDELLDTWMQICRGSGVLVKNKNGDWKIAHYVLSMTVPNDATEAVLKVKADAEQKQRELFKN